jgi:hypothetical protein
MLFPHTRFPHLTSLTKFVTNLMLPLVGSGGIPKRSKVDIWRGNLGTSYVSQIEVEGLGLENLKCFLEQVLEVENSRKD